MRFTSHVTAAGGYIILISKTPVPRSCCTATCSGSASFDHEGRFLMAERCRTFIGEELLFSSIIVAEVSHAKLVMPGAPRTSALFWPAAAAKVKLFGVGVEVMTYGPGAPHAH